MRRQLTIAVAAALAAAPLLANAVDPTPREYVSVPAGKACPTGTEILGYLDARDDNFAVCQVMGSWDIARIGGGGSISGRGYNCKVLESDSRSLGATICAKPKPLANVVRGPADVRPFGSSATFRPRVPGSGDKGFPKNQPCPTATYKVPEGATYVRITATGGSGLGGDAANIVNGMAALAGGTLGPAGNWAEVKGGSGGRGATVSALFPVKGGQVLYVVAGMSAIQGAVAGRGGNTVGFPGGGRGHHAGGGFSMVSLEPPTRWAVDPDDSCNVPQAQILVIAGGGGGGGFPGNVNYGGNGGDAGLLGKNASDGSAGNGPKSGGGGGGGGQTRGGNIGSNPGCGTSDRTEGRYLHGSNVGSSGGSGGGGLYGGGGGGDGDCFMGTGNGGGGGGSSYVGPTAVFPESSIDKTYDSKVFIMPMK